MHFQTHQMKHASLINQDKTEMNRSLNTQSRSQSCGYSLNANNDTLTESLLIQQQLLLELQQEASMKQREAYVGCDRNGYAHYIEDSVLSSTNSIKYSMIGELGRGTYSRVFKCKRVDENWAYAIKVIRNLDKYQKAAMHEIDILKHIKAHDVDDTSCCIHIVDAGIYFSHPIFIFPLLSDPLRS
eukprot:232610_1